MATASETQTNKRPPHMLLPGEPAIDRVAFEGEHIHVYLKDGRLLTAPLRLYPPILELTPAQREKHQVFGKIGLMFDDSDFVYHISDFLGLDNSVGL